MSNSLGKIFRLRRRRSTSNAAVSTEGGPSADEWASVAESPWARKSTNSTCHAGCSCTTILILPSQSVILSLQCSERKSSSQCLTNPKYRLEDNQESTSKSILVNDFRFLLFPRMPCTRTAVGGALRGSDMEHHFA